MPRSLIHICRRGGGREGGGEINSEKCPTFLPMCVVRATFGAALGPHRILQFLLFSVVCCLESLFLFFPSSTQKQQGNVSLGTTLVRLEDIHVIMITMC